MRSDAVWLRLTSKNGGVRDRRGFCWTAKDS